MSETINEIVKQLREESANLSRAADLLEGSKKRKVRAYHKKRTLSVAGRKRIAAAQKARWAKLRVMNGGKKMAKAA